VSKLRRLEDILKASFQIFYPCAAFDGSKEEEKNDLADKVLRAEAEILRLLRLRCIQSRNRFDPVCGCRGGRVESFPGE
jgi:hypothetical protein